MPRMFLVVLFTALFATCAAADPINVPYTTTGVNLTFLFNDGGGDTFNLTGLNGTLALDNSATTTNAINVGTYTTVYTNGTGVQTFDLSYDLTLDGVTHTLTQPTTWTITLGDDTFVTGLSSAPVLFDTPSGAWNVTLDAFSINNGAVAGTIPLEVSADFAPVPEPSSLLLLGTGAIGAVGAVKKKLLG